MRQALVAGNWKMNGSLESNEALLKGLLEQLGDVTAKVAVCPSFVYLSQARDLLTGSQLSFGGQDLSKESSGAFTGEISAEMLKDFGCEYVIVGHSERREYHGESNELVAQKTQVALNAGLIPLFCVGEHLEDRESDNTESVIAGQLDATIDVCGIDAFENIVIAYEPVWAIGTGKTATSEQAQEVHAFIRNRLAGHDQNVAEQTTILYGGSVKAANAEELFSMPDVDGGLVGGASLDATEFAAICKAAK